MPNEPFDRNLLHACRKRGKEGSADMKSPAMSQAIVSRLAAGACVLAVAMSVCSFFGEMRAASGCDEGVDVQITTDKRLYAQGATIRVRFLVKNTDQTPLYLFRPIGQCSSPLGSLSLSMRDPHNQEVRSFACAVDYNMDEVDPVRELTDSKFGVRLEKDDIFGRVQEYKLPKEKGLYRLQAELGQVGYLTDEQNDALSQHHMRILHHSCSSPTVVIEVK
jgi:hypothetical protein